MGVPGLWPFINKHFGKNAVKTIIKEKSLATTFDYVYLDANGLLHGAAQFIFNYGPNKKYLDPNKELTYDEKLKATFETFFDNIVDVVSVVKPDKVLYIAIDGPAPRAKQNQQRERRFVSAMNRSSDDTGFDSNSISPGTEFMHKLSQFMYYKIRKHINDNSSSFWNDIEVIYSPPTIPGEGEHKIMDYIRELPTKEKTDSTHCMFGPDGDLIMLTLSAHVEHISLFREVQDDASLYHLINMSKIRKELSYILGQRRAVKMNTRTKDDVSNDFVLMGFFVGNDFLPKIKMFYYLEDGLNKMINNYITTSTSGFANQYITNNGVIDIEGFKLFVKELSLNENEYLQNQRRFKPKHSKFIDVTLESCIYEGKIDTNEYKKRYYSKFGISEDEVDTVCKEYFRNLVWVFLYYTKGLVSWDESYKYHYAPLMSDFYNYLSKLTQYDLDHDVKFDRSSPALPFEQLLSILPAASRNLLPKYYRPLMYHENSELVKLGYYPEKFDIDYEGKRKDYQGIALLPFVNYNYIKSAYIDRKNGKRLYDEEDISDKRLKWYRNEYGEVASFKYNKNHKKIKFSSYYGIINNCQVKKYILK